ncbi:TetR/AcrR family transcriptional regulator [Ruminococcaceae bacterium OttesenSCG-928-O06]|nr:TetR/AcrR family transcriptional regulator [Ruminococcaceae bacterium OttesenSCG-928-O06]
MTVRKELNVDDAQNTRERILLAAVKLFTARGYADVAIHEIASAAGIKAASLYNHFSGKEALFETIIDTVRDTYMLFYSRMDNGMEQAESFADVLDCLFSELDVIYDVLVYYGVSLICAEQFRSEKARGVYHDVLLKVGAEYSARQFQCCVDKGWASPFDVEALALLFNNSVLIGTQLRTQEELGREVPFKAKDMFQKLHTYMLACVKTR